MNIKSSEKTLFIIKPDIIHKKYEVLNYISQYFNIIFNTEFKFDEKLIKQLYPKDIKKKHFPALLELLLEEKSEIGIIHGDDVIKRFYEFAGNKTNPKECDPNSIRYKFGLGESYTKNQLPIIKNAIHRCKSKKEFEENIYIFRKYITI